MPKVIKALPGVLRVAVARSRPSGPTPTLSAPEIEARCKEVYNGAAFHSLALNLATRIKHRPVDLSRPFHTGIKLTRRHDEWLQMHHGDHLRYFQEEMNHILNEREIPVRFGRVALEARSTDRKNVPGEQLELVVTLEKPNGDSFQPAH